MLALFRKISTSPLSAACSPRALTARMIAPLWHDTRASMLPTVAGSIMMIIGTTGLAVDGARMYYVRDVLQRSLDSAGLAAGHAQNVEDMQSDAQMFFDANFKSSGEVAASSEITLNFSEEDDVIVLKAEAKVEPAFMGLFGMTTMTVSADTEITRVTRGMELVFVADVTGSMASGGKAADMREAATAMINIVYGEEDVNPNLHVAVVPYVTTVNVGSHRESWLKPSELTTIAKDLGSGQYFEYADEGWGGCVEARLTDSYDEGDQPPAGSSAPASDKEEYGMVPFLYPDDVDNDWRDGDEVGEYTYDNNDFTGYPNNAKGPNLGCPAEILPLTASKTSVINKINELVPYRRGGTASAIGMVWGWRALSPRWRGKWGGATPGDLPLDYDDGFVDKVAIVLTDGQNQFFDFEGGGPAGSDYTGYGRANDFAGSKSSALAEINARFGRICQSMKDNGILIYSITFGSTPNTTTRALYEQCASNTSFYFHAPTGADLDDAFDSIGRQLSNLRLSR